jgi:hypothetical protein
MNNPINSINPSNIVGGVPNSPLLLFQPFNVVVFLSFYSPIILSIVMLSLSFIYQNFKGFIYLAFLLGVVLLRNFVYLFSGSQPLKNDGTICTSIQYTKYGNPSFSAFVFAFTLMYLSLPMFSNGAPNFWVFSGLIIYFCVDIFIKIYKKCVIQMSDLIINVLLGLASSALIVSLMYVGGSSEYLFFNEVASNKVLCSVPKKQTFKCQVYKNGELIGSTNSA